MDLKLTSIGCIDMFFPSVSATNSDVISVALFNDIPAHVKVLTQSVFVASVQNVMNTTTNTFITKNLP